MKCYEKYILTFFCLVASYVNAQAVVCKDKNTAGYNTRSESAYLEMIPKDIQYGCGSPQGKQIFFKNNHSTRTIRGFVVKKWQYYNGYENREICELHHFEIKPREESNSMGCNYITETQPCTFTVYGKFVEP
ncbi:hypothetical protein [Pedobacter nanyangensis]|uniref:hypothetical protein n=1 Tax=Pedobacter nanyangensis TaxID=1562389 RepID=UPI000DE28C0A|nr:hypothetical protein [Pedobacter nanyangensis]